MTSRERWIIYPLLFLALGAALRDKMVPGNVEAFSVDCSQLTCHRLDVIGPEGDSGIRMGTVATGTGQIELYNADEEQIVRIGPDGSGKQGRIDTNSPGSLGNLNPALLRAFIQRELGRVFESMLHGPDAPEAPTEVPDEAAP